MYPYLNLGIVKLQSYFLVLVILITVTLFWVFKKSIKSNLPRNFVLDLTFLLIISGFLSARLFHIFFENQQFYFSRPLEMFQFWNGGFVFLGGFIGALISGILYTLFCKKKELLPRLLDFFSPILAFNYSIGRIGCFLAGCCYGKTCPFPWAVDGRHPTQIYAFFWDFILFIILIKIEKNMMKPEKKFAGLLFCVWLLGHGLGRFILEFYRDDFRGPIYILSISGWLSLGIIISSLSLYLFLKRRIRHYELSNSDGG